MWPLIGKGLLWAGAGLTALDIGGTALSLFKGSDPDEDELMERLEGNQIARRELERSNLKYMSRQAELADTLFTGLTDIDKNISSTMYPEMENILAGRQAVLSQTAARYQPTFGPLLDRGIIR